MDDNVYGRNGESPEGEQPPYYELSMLLKKETECEYCQKIIRVEESAILMIPKIRKGCAFCSVKCIFMYIARMVKRMVLDRKLKKTDVLQDSLGYERQWGPMIPPKELKKKIKGRQRLKKCNKNKQPPHSLHERKK